ncbi:MAG: hypothetical protein GWO20_08745, partial [Candidatus Korarchaeota archaeon]|nr:hypothetical protein [Candidatus Korarchaeota archaeon]NIU83505.1 hypothetical protein [Candidatus Thorarchaeota archaeon]NIW13774.1 hypothetical protein [Candidatus Thorarchaeota archaeon]NIW53521.1 hypothetical protein [Candidatus Korarchaeota archaeon]
MDAKLGEQQQKGKEKHSESKEKIRRRVGVATREKVEGLQGKQFNVELVSDELRLHGKLDVLLGLKNDRVVPVEI